MEEILYRIPGIYDCEEIIRTNLDEAGDDWAWDAVNVPAMWRKTGGEGVSWCTIDTDLDDQHPDVKDKLDDFADFVGRRSKFKNPHSTWCFTCTGGQEKNGYAVGLAPKSRGYAAAALNNQGSGISTAIARAINWATDKKCRVLSLSLGAPVESPEITNAINDFYAEVPDGIVIAAAGNEGEKSGHPMGWPALMPNVIAVGAMNRNGTRASFSSWDSNNLDVLGPGQDVIAGIPMNQGGLGRMSGTCVAEGEMVYTPQGPRPIESVEAGDVVYAYDEERLAERVVQAKWQRGTNDILHINTFAGRDPRVTPTHQCLAYNEKSNDLEWVEAQNLDKDRHMLVCGREMALQVNPYLDSVISEDLAYICGYFTGDGWIAATGHRNSTGGTKGATVSFAEKADAEKNARIQEVYERTVGKELHFNETGRWYYDSNVKMASIISCLGLSLGSRDKAFPYWVWSLSEKKRNSFWKGYLHTDGHQKESTIAFECGSKQIIDGVAAFADFKGWSRGARRYRDRFIKAPNSHSASTKRFFGVNMKRVPARWKSMDASRLRDMGLDPRSLALTKITKVRHFAEDVPVYDLSVPGADSFVASGAVVHNSMATPFVAGVACLWASLNPGKGVSAFRKSLQETSKDIGKPGYDEETGWGLITPNVLQGAKPDEPNDGGFTARFYNAQVIG